MNNLARKVRNFIFLGHGLTRVPKKNSKSVSDIFPIRKGEDWKTYFELLDVRNLINGKSTGGLHKVQFFFHDNDGRYLGKKSLGIGSAARTTVDMADFAERYRDAASFSVFHESLDSKEFKDSFLAERGYTGYEFRNISVRGYVHGNLDSLALNTDGSLQPLGKIGLFRRRYLVQHMMTGPAKYEFVITNPSRQKIFVQFNLKKERKNYKSKKILLPPKGLKTYEVFIEENDRAVMEVVSRLTMGRPVVFRITDKSMDVFHG